MDNNLVSSARQSLIDREESRAVIEQERIARIQQVVIEAQAQLLNDAALKNIDLQLISTPSGDAAFRLVTSNEIQYFIQMHSPGREPVYSHIDYASGTRSLQHPDKYGRYYSDSTSFKQTSYILGTPLLNSRLIGLGDNSDSHSSYAYFTNTEETVIEILKSALRLIDGNYTGYFGHCIYFHHLGPNPWKPLQTKVAKSIENKSWNKTNVLILVATFIVVYLGYIVL